MYEGRFVSNNSLGTEGVHSTVQGCWLVEDGLQDPKQGRNIQYVVSETRGILDMNMSMLDETFKTNVHATYRNITGSLVVDLQWRQNL